MVRALITGISGQDGGYLAKLLLSKGYEVWGAARRSASNENWRLKELGIENQVKMISFECLEYSNIVHALEKVQPDEIYNLAGMSFVGASFEQPVYTGDVNGLGVVRLLEAMRQVCPKAKMYQASTSEMFGSNYTTVMDVADRSTMGSTQTKNIQNESTPFHPRSPYGCSKLFAHSMVANYRESYDMFCCSGILFNHESPLRGSEFVTKKITRTLAKMYDVYGDRDDAFPHLQLGNMNARRDWGHAEDYVRGMWQMLQQDEPEDFVLSTGETRSVKDFVDAAVKALKWKPLIWSGEGQEMQARSSRGELVVSVNPVFYRPADVDYLCGNSRKAEEELGWKREYDFEALVASMVEYDLKNKL